MSVMKTGKYRPLSELLAAAACRDEPAVRLSFSEVADLVGTLPTSAYRRRGWWANGYLVQAKSWRSVGWRVRGVDLSEQWVSFVREPAARDDDPSVV